VIPDKKHAKSVARVSVIAHAGDGVSCVMLSLPDLQILAPGVF
jgi:hypothetical protein